MYVTVSLKIELDANASLSDWEVQIQQAGRAGMQAALKQALCHSEAHEQQCPKCGSERTQMQGTKRRVLLTRFGRVDVPLRRLRCHECGHLFRPAASYLAAIQGHNITPGLGELAALVGSSWPYATAARVLTQLSGVRLSSERLRHLTNERGRRLAQQQQRQAQDLLQGAVRMEQIRREREQSHPQGQQTQPDWLEVGLDGGWLLSREQPGGMEGKIGVVASQVEAVGKHGRHRLVKRRYVATFGTAEEVGQLTYAAACELAATEAVRQVVVGDGAEWIKTQANEHFPDAVKILDWPHLWRKIRDAVRAVAPGQQADRRAWRQAQYEVLLPLLWRGKPAQAHRYLQGWGAAAGPVPLAVEEALRYLETRAALGGQL